MIIGLLGLLLLLQTPWPPCQCCFGLISLSVGLSLSSVQLDASSFPHRHTVCLHKQVTAHPEQNRLLAPSPLLFSSHSPPLSVPAQDLDSHHHTYIPAMSIVVVVVVVVVVVQIVIWILTVVIIAFPASICIPTPDIAAVQLSSFDLIPPSGGRGGLTWQAHCEFVVSF